MATMTIFVAVLENYDGECKRLTVVAETVCDVWGTNFPGWHLVDVEVK